MVVSRIGRRPILARWWTENKRVKDPFIRHPSAPSLPSANLKHKNARSCFRVLKGGAPKRFFWKMSRVIGKEETFILKSFLLPLKSGFPK